MPAFAYRAVDPAGRNQRGVLEAASAAGARRALRERDLLPLSVSAAEATRTDSVEGEAATAGLARLFRPRLRGPALAQLTRQLSTLIGGGVRIEEALSTVAEQASAPAGPLLLAVRGSVLEGRSFAAALAEHPDAFPDFYRAAVAAGERSGRLAEVLAHLTEFVEGRERTRRRIQLALIYPSLLALVSGAIIVLLLIYVVPDITRVFVARGAELPFLTRALIAVSDGLVRWGWLMALAVLVAALAAGQWLRTPANALAFARFTANTPPLKRFVRQLNAARFAGSLATLVRSDVPLVDALTAAAAVTPNRWVRAQAEGAARRVREGSSLRRALTDTGAFPPLLLAVVASGEQGGRLGEGLQRAADDITRDLDGLTAALVALVEPAVLLLMGGIVLLMVLAILTPIVNLNNLAGL